MKILHISDIHFRQKYETCTEGYKGMLSEMRNPLIPLDQYLRQIQLTEKLDCLIISGDLTEDGGEADYAYLKNFLKERIGEMPLIVTLGNHDFKRNFRVGWLSEKASDQPYNSIQEFEEFSVISFDSSEHGQANGKIAKGQLSWLNHAFKKTRNKPVIFVTHHHLLEYQGPTPSLPGSERLLELLRNQKNLLCILNGHTHHHFTSEIGGIPYFTVDSMSFCGEDADGAIRFKERSGYNLYTVEQGQLAHRKSETLLASKVLKTIRRMDT